MRHRAALPSPPAKKPMTDPDAHRTQATAIDPAVLPARAAILLLGNGQTTEGTTHSVERLSAALGRPVRLRVRWGQATLFPVSGGTPAFADVEPAGVDISRVAAVEAVVDAVCAGTAEPADAVQDFDRIGRAPPVSLPRFAIMAGAGAAALALIFGAPDLLTVLVVAVIAGLGACLRRAASRLGSNPLLQPLVAALLAGLAAGLVARMHLPVALRLVAVCPCMVLVPGPHFLNGMIDLVRARIPIGACRLALAGLIVLVICTGLLTGLTLAGVPFPPAEAARPVPLGLDVLAAGVAVAAYGSFFNMPWRMLAAPVATGMAAHALHWELLQLGAGVPMAALGATLVAGAAISVLSRRLHVPFGAAAFACTVSLIPGLYMFQVASGLVSIARLGSQAGWEKLLDVTANASTAGLTLLAMSAGLILPKLCADELRDLRRGR